MMKIEHYRSLLAGTPKLEVEPIPKARHFAMFDQPELVADAVRRFLNRL
ncbi:alpha/beta fold hydrolase [Massilia yuzhufengensis]|uniref:Pimeloyl-ACP methyl ester carboxylesterase n=1 Tax=Massilia yuzhufengensis TaxID=1164594 RepID=A0A1I1MEW0_9BURK|nr:hypothetical protein [Massilia yuzhufengensis]SFC81203.1 hypothetical protein SAMN05216204_110134 [Massilia yuzhufengensis]